MQSNYGTLYLVPAPLSPNQKDFLLEKDKPLVADLKYYIVETPKVARSFLKGLTNHKIQDVDIQKFDKNSKDDEIMELLQPLIDGNDLGYMSDAGVPAVADPGNKVVLMAHRLGITVTPLVGPSSILLALMASGLNGQSFKFHGYVPSDRNLRTEYLRNIEADLFRTGETQIFMDTPYRSPHVYESILKTCSKNTLLSIAYSIDMEDEMYMTKPIDQWRKSNVSIENRPMIFMLGTNSKKGQRRKRYIKH